jgi:hypothetical protein
MTSRRYTFDQTATILDQPFDDPDLDVRDGEDRRPNRCLIQ